MQIDMTSDNIYQEQTDIMEKLREFAINKNVHIHLVAHPKKTERFQTRLTLYDVAGSSNLVNKAYNIISILRMDNIKKIPKDYEKIQSELTEEHYDINEVDTVLDILKTKGERCGLVGFAGCCMGRYMLMNESRRRTAMELLKNGFIEMTPENVKNYFDGFILQGRNGKYYEQLGKKVIDEEDYSTEYTEFDYLSALYGFIRLDEPYSELLSKKIRKSDIIFDPNLVKSGMRLYRR